MSKWEQNAVFEYSEYICLVKRINGIVAQKTLVTELVRCKECKWRGIPTACPIDNFYAQRWTKDDDFCSYGERKDKCKECWHWSEAHKRCENKCGCQFKPYGEREGE